MGKMKIYEIAKELNLTSKEVMDIASKLNIEAKSHLSNVEDKDAKSIEQYVKNNRTKKENKNNYKLI